MKDTESRKFSELIDWASQHGARLHPSLEIYNDDTTKFSLRVRPSSPSQLPIPENNDEHEGFGAVSCPVSTTLSYLNALVGGPVTLGAQQEEHATSTFPPRFMDQVPPHVIGRFFLIQQYLQSNTSFWRPYIATLPQPEHIISWTLPAFWPEDDIALLEGTNAHVAIQEMQANVKREFKQARKILKEENFPDWQDYTRMLYNWAFCIFTSRSFRPSLIFSQPAKQEILAVLPPGCELDDFSILQPIFDIANHKMTARYTWDVSSDPLSCRLICRDTYQPGDQVYNNYGLKSNSELLLGYGFILPETPELHNDYVHVRKRVQEEVSSGSHKPKDFLISLRPINHPSSLLGRSRQPNLSDPQLHALPQFVHFEPALIYDLAFAMSTDEEKATIDKLMSTGLDKSAGDGAELQGLENLVVRVQEALRAKLLFDYQRLDETDPFVVDETDEEAWEPTSQNEKMAVAYRKQCAKVLFAALQAVAL